MNSIARKEIRETQDAIENNNSRFIKHYLIRVPSDKPKPLTETPFQTPLTLVFH